MEKHQDDLVIIEYCINDWKPLLRSKRGRRRQLAKRRQRPPHTTAITIIIRYPFPVYVLGNTIRP